MERMRVLAVAAMMMAGLGTGCSKKAAAPATTSSTQNKYTQDALAAGGTLNSDGSVTNANGSVTEPNGTVVPAAANAPADSAAGAQPVASTPAAPTGSATAAGPIARTAPAGTAVTIRTNETISSKGDADGQRFNGVLERPVVSHGTVVFERGMPVTGEVVSEKNKGTFKGAGQLGVVLTAIAGVPVHTSEYVLVNKGRGKRTGAFIGGGGGLGALIGGIAGGGKGALIGGLAGAGAGTAASTTGSKDVVIRSESVITFRLREAVSH